MQSDRLHVSKKENFCSSELIIKIGRELQKKKTINISSLEIYLSMELAGMGQADNTAEMEGG